MGENMNKDMIDQRTWKEFRKTGLLWFINSFLHAFGWAIVIGMNDNGEIKEIFPARCKFRGFDQQTMIDGHRQVSQHLKDNIDEIKKEADE